MNNWNESPNWNSPSTINAGKEFSAADGLLAGDVVRIVENVIYLYNNLGNALNLENGTGTGSLVQKRLKSDGVTWTTAKAYQGASTALGGGTQAGRTEEEFNNYFWDSVNNKPINGGKGKNSEGKILDNNGLTYEQSYSYAVAEGELTKALGRSSHSEGNNTKAIGTHSHAEGISSKAEGYASHAEGNTTNAVGAYSHSEGTGTISNGENSHSEGANTTASGTNSHAEGSGVKALGSNAHAEGQSTNAFEENSHAEGKLTTASGSGCHAEGESTIASGLQCHAEGLNTKASGRQAHAEGYKTTAIGYGPHAEGGGTTASGGYSHAEGFGTVASNDESHAEGHSTIASGLQSHAEGMSTQAIDMYSHTEGYYTKSSRESQHVEGKYNTDNPNALHIVGNGTSETDRKNAFEVLQDGRAKVQSAPIASDDVVRKLELDYLSNKINTVYRVIRDITLEQDTKEVHITTDENGNPLKLKNVFVQFSGQFTGTVGFRTFQLALNGGILYGMRTAYNINYIKSDNPKDIYGHWAIVEKQNIPNRNLFMSHYPANILLTGWGSDYNAMQGLSSSAQHEIAVPIESPAAPSINEIVYGQLEETNGLMAAGSKIFIWGIDDDE